MKKVLSIGTALAVSSTLAYSAEASDQTVEQGDTISELAQSNNTTVDTIKSNNNIESNIIVPGQVLEINGEKSSGEESSENGLYEIQSGDTLFEIAADFDTTVSNLKEWNNLSSDLIFAGKTLAVTGENAEQAPAVEAPQVQENESNEVASQEQEQQAQEQREAEQQQAQEQQEQQAQEQREAEQQQAQEQQEQQAQEQREAEQQQAQEQQEQQAQEQREAEQQQAQEQQEQQAQTENQSTSTSSNSSGQNWDAVAQCESGGDPSVVSSNGLYHGLYQFDVQTWQSVGGSGTPSQASAAEQTKRAEMLYDQRGSQPWPVCGSNL